MATFTLQIITPERLLFSGEAKMIRVRASTGDMAILAGHIDFAGALGIGEAKVVFPDGTERLAACNSGVLTMKDNVCRVAAVTFEWADEIDTERAQKAEEAARKRLEAIQDRESHEWSLADAKLRRALARLNVKH